MAIIDKNGKVRGRIGNYIHREVNGKQVIQSSPKPRKPKGGTVDQNNQFREAAQLSAIMYDEIKNFAWDRSYSYLHGRLTSSIKQLLFSGTGEQHAGQYIALDKDNKLNEIFAEPPVASKAGNLLEINIPKVKAAKGNKKLANANFLSYEVALMGFTDDEDLLIEHLLKTKRFRLGNEYSEQQLTVDLDEVLTFRSGLLVALIRTELFKYENSAAFLNSKDVNPVSILGIWKLG